MKKPFVSIAIPYHDTPKTPWFLARCLASIYDQTWKDYEIVLTKEGKMAENLNAAIRKSRGEIIKIMSMDDYFSYSDSLEKIVMGFQENKDTIWQITGCLHEYGGKIGNPHKPYWTDDIYTGNNRLGSVTTLSFRKENTLFFEEPLTWMLDCDLYYRHYLFHGPPQLLTSHNVVIYQGEEQTTNKLTEELKVKEIEYLIKKYD